ncbi:hypothetical protein AKO1_011715 [Acrasis kona]|uniref:Uncharacterized protein n=1 Tax=Acrasis kona TaxID=1008807 RepID=A0AAW2Z635_9EUKA
MLLSVNRFLDKIKLPGHERRQLSKEVRRGSITEFTNVVKRTKSKLNFRFSHNPVEDNESKLGHSPVIEGPERSFLKVMISNIRIQAIISRYDTLNYLEVWNKIQEYKNSYMTGERKEIAHYMYENYTFQTDYDQHELWLRIDVGMFEDEMLDRIELEVEAVLSETLNRHFSSNEVERCFVQQRST